MSTLDEQPAGPAPGSARASDHRPPERPHGPTDRQIESAGFPGRPSGPTCLQIEGARFDHVAHAATQISELLPLYRDVLGGRFTSGAPNEQLGYRTLHLAYADGSKIELMEPLHGSRFLESFFARNPLGGLHHVTFRVPSLDDALAAARAAGLETFGESRELPGWSEAFVHPRVAHGTIVQIAEAQERFPPPATVSLEEFLAGR